MLSDWKGEFGDEYTERNSPDPRVRFRVFKKILPESVDSILEVGCNKGINLYALRALLPFSPIAGVEVNKKVLSEGVPPFLVTDSSSYLLNKSTDLVFTCGVLIHVPTEDLEETMREIIRVSKRYVLAIEYYAPEETEVVYRGKVDMLWKRDYGKAYKYLGLKLLKTGEVPEIDNSTYWLFQK